MKQILTVILSSLVALYIVEALLISHGYYKKVNNLQEKIKIYKDKTGRNFDTRPFYKAYYDSKKNIDGLVPMIPVRESLEIDAGPYSLSNGISNSPTMFCNENGYYTKYLSDQYGFNNPANQWNQKSIEYLIIGDSFVHGMCVNESDTISGNLRKAINQGVLNLGNSGTGPLAQYATLREYLPLVNVKRIIWIYFEGNDLLDLDYELKNKTLSSYLTDKKYTQKLSAKQNDINIRYRNIIENVLNENHNQIDGFSSYILSVKKFIKLVSLRIFIKNLYRPMKSTSLINYNPNYEKYSDILKLTKIYAEENNSRLYFVYLPDYFRIVTNRLEDKELFGYKKVISLTKELQIDTIDLNKEFLNLSYDLKTLYPFKKLGHFNNKGYSEVTKLIKKVVKENEVEN
jgi:hypothetical protein